MKKIFIIFLLWLFAITIFGQNDNVRMVVNKSDSTISFFNGFIPLRIRAYTGEPIVVGDHYVATIGNDNNPGTLTEPWGTWQKGFDNTAAGETTYIRGGTYPSPNPANAAGVYVNNVDGSAGNLRSIIAYPGEIPILDLSNCTVSGVPLFGIHMTDCDYWYLKGLKITGVQQNAGQQSSGVELQRCNNNILEQVDSYNNHACGMVLYGTYPAGGVCTGNLYLNCDLYNNDDPDAYNNGNGFTMVYISAGTTNTIRGCRAWNNQGGEGFGIWSNEGYVAIDSCWSFNNTGNPGDGNGFELGLTYNPVAGTKRYVTNSISVGNEEYGFSESNADLIMELYNNLATGNGAGYSFGGSNPDKLHIIKNNVDYGNTGASGWNASYIHSNNSWDSGVTASAADFVSVDVTQLDNPRHSNGNLPDITCFWPVTGSDLIDAGTDVGIAYVGANPDIGVFEYDGLLALLIEGVTTNNAETGYWEGISIARSVPTALSFLNNSVTSVNTTGYMVPVGDDEEREFNNNLNGAIITGNKLTWNGTGSSGTHGLAIGYNINQDVKYNYFDKTPIGIVFKSGTIAGVNMTNTSGGAAYNIFKDPKIVGLLVKGINGTQIYNNTFYSSLSTTETLLVIQENPYSSPTVGATGTKIYNNIFYSVYAIEDIYVMANCVTGFESDYNIFYCEGGNPKFNLGGVVHTLAEWQGHGYDTHSVVVDPDFINTTAFVPTSRLDYGTNLGATWQTGLSTTAVWTVGVAPATHNQDATWQVGARTY